ncbi:MAG TPA: GNAT family acetyltransferase [Mycobacteriales bacterium]|nr:GNAT family acetyltransferase [Mycobacteriales bacterium]
MEILDLPHELYAEAIRLWEDAGLTRPWNDPKQDLQRAVAGPASTVLAAVADGALIGTAMVGHDGHRGWVYYVAVAQADRARGVGRALMGAAESWVVERGIPKLQLMVRADNEAALGFYARLGYEQGDVLMLGRRLDP